VNALLPAALALRPPTQPAAAAPLLHKRQETVFAFQVRFQTFVQIALI
jgi:hypothetical protein